MEITSIMELLKSVPKVSELLFNYLITRSNNDYNKLEMAAKLYGFTAQQIFDNIDVESFINSYRSTDAISASINMVKNSDEFSDIEKYDKLNELHNKEILQQNRAQNFEIKKKIVNTIQTTLLLSSSAFLINHIANKNRIPIISPKKKILTLPSFRSKSLPMKK